MGSRPSVRRPGGSCGSRPSRISAAGRFPEVEAAHVHVSASRGSRSGPSSRSPGPRAFPGRSSPFLARPVSCVSYLYGNLVLLLRTPRIRHGLDATTETGHQAGRAPTSTVDTHSSRRQGNVDRHVSSACDWSARRVAAACGSRLDQSAPSPVPPVLSASAHCLFVCLMVSRGHSRAKAGSSPENHSPPDSVGRGDERSSGDC